MSSEIAFTQIRNIGFIAHIDAGKTTTTERVLFFTGKTYKIGEVDYGTAQMDWMEQERERGITIQSAVTTTYWREHQINIIDTPGHVDFTLEVEKAIKVLDGLVVIFDGVAGVQPQSETVWHQADRFHVPRIVFINKLDRPGADYRFAIDDIKKKFDVVSVPINIPYYDEGILKGVIDLYKIKLLLWDNEKLEYEEKPVPQELSDEVETQRNIMLESIVEHDEKLMALYLDNEEIPHDRFKGLLRKLVLSQEVIPVFCGASLKNIGVHQLLDGIVDYLPSPLDNSPISGVIPGKDEQVLIDVEKEDHFLGYVFKILKDPFLDKLSYVRIYSGSLKEGQHIFNDVSRKKERIAKIFLIHANHRVEVKEIGPGSIVGIAGLKFTQTGDTLSTPGFPLMLERLETPNPVISLAIEPRSTKDYKKLLEALANFEIEDSSFKFNESKETGQLIIYGMGELHLEIIIDRLRREYKIDINAGEPRVSYRESISEVSKNVQGIVENDMGKAQVTIDMEPLGSFDKNEVTIKIGEKASSFPKNFLADIKSTAENVLNIGILSGYQLLGVKVLIKDIEVVQENYNIVLIKMALSNALRSALGKGSSVILEPYMKFEIYVPEEYFGDVFSSINGKGANIDDVIVKGNIKILKGKVPLSKMFKYTTTLRSLTQGRGSINLEFEEFIPVSPEEQKRLLQLY